MNKANNKEMTKKQITKNMLDNGISTDDLRKILTAKWMEDFPPSALEQKPTFAELEEKNHEIVRQYCKWLADTGEIHSRRTLREFDTIDVTNLIEVENNFPSVLPPMMLTEDESKFLKESWYNSIPPLKKGVLHINRDRYIQFDTFEINEAEQSFTEILIDYAYDGGIWMIDKTITVYFESRREKGSFVIIKSASMADIFIHKKPDGIGWSERDRAFWDNVTVPIMLVTCDKDKEKDDRDLANHFIVAVAKTNYLLSLNKPKAERTNTKKSKVKAVVAPENERKKQIVRKVGSISIKSVKIPRAPTMEIIRKYKVAAWNTRGHLRHYKSGKIAYVKPSIHHRKCLQQDGTVAQTIIHIEK